jgi:hypothetical protein
MTVLQWFWWLLTMACVVWYSTITVYVAIRGAADIKSMLKRLADTKDELAEPPGSRLGGQKP